MPFAMLSAVSYPDKRAKRKAPLPLPCAASKGAFCMVNNRMCYFFIVSGSMITLMLLPPPMMTFFMNLAIFSGVISLTIFL